MKLTILNESILTYKDRASTGIIYFESGNVAFPEEGWNDFIDVVLNWWMDELTDFYENGTSKATLNFMDGPFRVELTRNTQSGILDVFLIEDYSTPVIRQTEAQEQEILSSVALAVNGVLRYCQIHHLDSEEFGKLRDRFSLFQQKIRKNIS